MTEPTPSPKIDVYHVAAVGLALFAFFMAALISRTVFERMPHLEDEVAYLYQARIFARGDVVIDSPQPSSAYWQPFVIDYEETGKRAGKYTPGWPALLALGVLAGQMWVINAFAAALTVVLTYRLGREVFGRDAGIIAAGLMAFSPMALLLNATLMGHTTALCAVTAFMYAFWRLALGRHRLRWGALAGLALGLLITNRAVTALGVAAPFVIWSGLRIAASALRGYADARDDPVQAVWQSARPVLVPLLMLAAVALAVGSAVPAFNYAVTEDPTYNLYTEVWEYDQLGFGPCCGRSSLPQNGGEGHTIIKGIRHARFDLSLMAADLFGWQLGEMTPELQDHLRTESDYWPVLGISWILIPAGLAVGFRKKTWLMAWLAVWFVMLIDPLRDDAAWLKGDAELLWYWVGFLILMQLIPAAGLAFRRSVFGWLGAWLVVWLIVLIVPLIDDPVWMNDVRELDREWMELLVFLLAVPVLGLILKDKLDRKPDREANWTWLLLGVVVGLIGIHLAYWIGSQRYSTRYYFEALSALALLSALPIAWLLGWIMWLARYIAPWAHHVARIVVYGAFGGLLVFSLYTYSTPRIEALYRFNFISPVQADEVQARAEGDQPVLVVVMQGPGEDNTVRWRSYGSLMTVTGPYLDTDIVVARAYSAQDRLDLIAEFPDRQVVDLLANGNDWWFPADVSVPSGSPPGEARDDVENPGESDG